MGRQRKDDETQVTKPPRSKPKRAWELIALVAVVDALVVGELIFQWARPRARATDTVHDGYWICCPLS
jgi:hypothetical protein